MNPRDSSRVVAGMLFGAIVLLAFVNIVKAETPCEKWTGVHEGKKASCTGVAGPEGWVRDGEKCVQAKLPKCEEKRQIEKEKREADKTAHDTVLRETTKRADTCCKLALAPKTPLPDPAWYETVEFKVTAGVVVSGVVVGIFVALLYETGAVEL